MSSSGMESIRRFNKHYISGWDKWIIVDLKYNRDNEVRDWRKRGLPGKQPIWRGTEEDADNLAELLNKDAEAAGNGLVKKAERGQSEYVPWQNRARKKRSAAHAVQNSPFKKCACGARYKGDKHCE